MSPMLGNWDAMRADALAGSTPAPGSSRFATATRRGAAAAVGVVCAIGLMLCGINFLVSRRLETKPVPREFT